MLSFEELYLAYSLDVFRFAYWLSGDKGEAEDITSETFVRAWMNFQVIRTETLKAYLFTITRNIYLESLRKNHTHHPIEEHHPDIRPRVERAIEDQNELDAIKGFLQTLSEKEVAMETLQEAKKWTVSLHSDWRSSSVFLRFARS